MFTNIRRMVALLVAFIMAFLSVSITAHSEPPTGTITVNQAIEKEEYHLYKVFDVTYDDGHAASTYQKMGESDAFLTALLEASSPFRLDRIMDTDTYNVSIKQGLSNSEESVSSFLKANVSLLTESSATSSSLDSNSYALGDTVLWTGVPFGYYYVSSSAGAYVMLDSTTPNISVMEKNTVPVFTAKQKRTDTDEYSTNKISTHMNAPVYYRIEVKQGKGNDHQMTVVSQLVNLKGFHDISITQLSNGTGTPVVVDPSMYTAVISADDKTLTVTFSDTYVATLQESDVIYIDYNSQLSTDAKTMSQQNNANYNIVSFTYSNQHSQQTLYTETTKITLAKTDASHVMLDGAVFHMYTQPTGGTPLTFKQQSDYMIPDPTGSSDLNLSIVHIKGIAAGTYYLEEVKAPAGYQRLKQRHQIDVTQDETDTVNMTSGVVTGGFQIVNTPGITLPASGSVSHLLLVVAGCISMVAGIYLVIRYRHV